jgi:hypothetical protein
MNSPHQSLRLALCLALTASVHADESGSQPQLTFTPGTSDTWNADWAGVTQRTYFFQWSQDLETWHYAPFVEFDFGSKSYGVQTQNVEKFFVRLQYTNVDWVGTLQEAKDADFDSDGIPNLFEVETVDSNPLDKQSAGGNSDGDGLADGWERYYFGGLDIADPNAKLSPDGLTNKEKSELGLGPLGDNLTLATERIAYSYDGERLQNVNFYTQREFDYGLDGNGNIETSTSD